MNNNLPEKKRFQVLDIFRGIFACLVFLFHLRPFANGSILDNKFILNSDLFVDFFFILSGFVIALSYSNLNNLTELKGFLSRRILRIYPLHFLMLILFLVIELLKRPLSEFVHVNNINSIENTAGSFISSLLLLHSTPFLNNYAVSWNIPSWSISAEMIAYVVFSTSIFISSFKMLSVFKDKTHYIILLLAVCCLLWGTGSMKIDYTYDFGFLRGIIGFNVGIITYHLYLLIKARIIAANLVLMSFLEIGILLIVCCAIFFGEMLKVYGLVYEVIFALCILIFCSENGVISLSLKKSLFLKTLGKYSYSIYMTHALMISLFNIFFIRILNFQTSSYSFLFLLNFLLVYFFSMWTYKNIEMRFYSTTTKINGRSS